MQHIKNWQDVDRDMLEIGALDGKPGVEILAGSYHDYKSDFLEPFHIESLEQLDQIIAHLTSLREVFGAKDAVSVADILTEIDRKIAIHQNAYESNRLEFTVQMVESAAMGPLKSLKRFIKGEQS